MSLNLVKLCVGVSSVEQLEMYRDERLQFGRRLGGEENINVHRTRMMPRRADEIVGKGSLYWVMGGQIACRQPIEALKQSEDENGRSCCDILMSPYIIRTFLMPKRPFQGWRYLKPSDAPGDLDAALGEGEGDLGIAQDLSDLGLI